MNFNYFATPEDMKLVMRLASEQKLGVVPQRYRIAEPEPSIVLAADYVLGEEAFCFVPHEYSMDDIPYIEGTKGRKGWAIMDQETAPVIYVEPPVLWATKLDAGTMFIEESVTAHKMSLTTVRFRYMWNMIKRWARADQKQGYIGPHAERLVREKRLQLGLGKRSVEIW